MDIIETIKIRHSIRAFKPDPIPKDILRQVMEMATWAPSWSNIQPWEFEVVAGEKLKAIQDACVSKAQEEPVVDIPRPAPFPEPYEGRHRAQGARFLNARGIKREDREGRGWWRLQGLKHFGAPCVIYICTERVLYYQPDRVNSWPLFDCGMAAENLMLAATKFGLGTIPQAQAVFYTDVIKKILQIPDSKLIVLGIPIGYPDQTDPINKLRSDREPMDNIVRWHGFE